MYASFLFNCVKTVPVSQPDDKTTTELVGNQREYYLNLRYQISTQEPEDELFEQLKPIAYHRLQQLKQHLPS
jgi:hypothetical protein